jgi:hypothetical protein
MLSEMPHRPRHVPIGDDYWNEEHLHPGHIWDCRACVRKDPTLDLGRRGCHRCPSWAWTSEGGGDGTTD